MPSPLNINEIRALVERACGSPALAGAPRLQRLLRFLAEETVAGGPPKETVIGAEVFDRAPDYDPKADSVVRTEVRRLRLKLAEYYAGEGASERTRIDIPKGAYAVRLERRAEETAPIVKPAPLWRGWPRSAAISAILIPCAVATVSWLNVHKPPSGEVIAVLPFEAAQGDAQANRTASDLTSQVTESLSRVPALRVISRSSADRGGSDGPEARAAALHARYVVTGNLAAMGSGSRVHVTVLAEPGNRVLARSEYETGSSDLSERISNGVSLSLGARQAEVAAHTRTIVPGVQERFLEGRRLWGTRQKANLDKSIELFQEAAARDPEYVWDYVGIADSYSVLAANSWENAMEITPKAEAAARRAVALSPGLAEAHASLGLVFYSQWNWKGADQELQEARGLNPNLSVALFRSALVLCAFGRFDEALRTLEDAEVIDPFSPFLPGAIVEIQAYKRDYPASLEAAREAQRKMPGLFYGAFWAPLWRMGRIDEARASLREWKEHGAGPLELATIGIVIRAANDLPGARAQFERVRQEGVLRLAHCQASSIYAALGERDGALTEMEKALAARETDLVSIQWDPGFDGMRSDPRYLRVMSAMGLPAR